MTVVEPHENAAAERDRGALTFHVADEPARVRNGLRDAIDHDDEPGAYSVREGSKPYVGHISGFRFVVSSRPASVRQRSYVFAGTIERAAGGTVVTGRVRLTTSTVVGMAVWYGLLGLISSATASRAVRAWRAGEPVPIEPQAAMVMAFMVLFGLFVVPLALASMRRAEERRIRELFARITPAD